MKARRPEIAPGSLADRIRTTCPAGTGASMETIVKHALARPEDVRAKVLRLRASGYIRVSGETRRRRYFWRRTNRRKASR